MHLVLLDSEIELGDVGAKEQRDRPIEHDAEPPVPARHLEEVMGAPEHQAGNPVILSPMTRATAREWPRDATVGSGDPGALSIRAALSSVGGRWQAMSARADVDWTNESAPDRGAESLRLEPGDPRYRAVVYPPRAAWAMIMALPLPGNPRRACLVLAA